VQKQELPKSEQCLNCGHTIHEYKYCPECGQENADYRVRLGVLIRYYLSKYLRLDIKWVRTVKTLLWQPWKLTETFLSGKRKQYTHPFRLYLVLSVLFFLGLRLQVVNQSPDNDKRKLKLNFFTVQTERDVNMQKVLNQIMAQLPNAVLLSVPLSALVLTGFYYMSKKYFFFDHFILMLHYYAYVFLISLPFLFIPQIGDFSFISLLLAIVYLWLFMKQFYQENILKTTLKYIFFSLLSSFIITILSVLLVFAILTKEMILA